MPRSPPDSTPRRSPDSWDREVHLSARTGSRDPRRHRFDAVVATFVTACRAAVLSERTIEFDLEALNSYRAFAGGTVVDLTLADLELGRARAWLADFVERGRKPATVAARARATRLRILDVGAGQLRVLGKGGDERAVPYGRTLDAALRQYLTRERPDDVPAFWVDCWLSRRRERPRGRAQ